MIEFFKIKYENEGMKRDRVSFAIITQNFQLNTFND
jgi:hypothetical protein